jgi:hypothetical protein
MLSDGCLSGRQSLSTTRAHQGAVVVRDDKLVAARTQACSGSAQRTPLWLGDTSGTFDLSYGAAAGDRGFAGQPDVDRASAIVRADRMLMAAEVALTHAGVIDIALAHYRR